MADDFQTTRWSLVLAAGGGDGSRAAAALEQLCMNAWRPLYAFARRSGRSPEDAEDLVPGFFASLIEGNGLASVDRGRGRFRSFMLAAMKYHMADERNKRCAARRGGDAVHLPLDLEDAEDSFLKSSPTEGFPDKDYDRDWTHELLRRARARLLSECESTAKYPICCELFPERESPGEESYAEMANRLGMKESTLRSTAFRLRRRWGELIRAEVAETVHSRESFEQEMEALKESLMG